MLLFLLIDLVVPCVVLLLKFEVLLALADLLLKLTVTGDTGVVRHMAMACIHMRLGLVGLLLMLGITLVKENALIVSAPCGRYLTFVIVLALAWKET